MNVNESNNLPSENAPLHTEGMTNQISDIGTEQQPTQPSDNKEDIKPKEGFSFNLINLILGVVFCSWMFDGDNIFTDNFFIYLCIVVIIHELGHVIIGKSFGCVINGVQIFFLPFVSYKPKQDSNSNSWHNITWSLGALPLGGVTLFKSKESDIIDIENDPAQKVSPYIEDKNAWQRLLISAAGVLFNIATFIILYCTLPYIPTQYSDVLWPLTVLSLILAVINILPIYPLDGGAIVFALFEIFAGKKPSPGFTKVCGWIGFIIIILFFWVFPEWMDGVINGVIGLFFEQ